MPGNESITNPETLLNAKSVWCSFDLIEDPKEEPARTAHLQSRITHDLQRFAVPMTAQRFREFVCVVILPVAKPFAITSPVLQ